jgi:hypothetical protein
MNVIIALQVFWNKPERVILLKCCSVGFWVSTLNLALNAEMYTMNEWNGFELNILLLRIKHLHSHILEIATQTIIIHVSRQVYVGNQKCPETLSFTNDTSKYRIHCDYIEGCSVRVQSIWKNRLYLCEVQVCK